MSIILGCLFGFIAWFLVRYLMAGMFTVNQNERAVKTSFGRAERVGNATTNDDPIAASLRPEERERYCHPQVRVIPPGGPYFRWPWEKVYKVTIATQTVGMAFDPETPSANQGGTVLEVVTKDQLNTGLTGPIEEKVVNRLRQVTSAIKQDGANQVNIIRSTADRQAAVEFARAAAMRPQIVGKALHEIAREPVIARAMFDVLETEKIVEGEADIALVPAGSGMLKELLAAAGGRPGKAAPPPLTG